MFLESMPIGTLGAHAAGRVLLRKMYEQYVGGALPELQVTERGKPYFVNSTWQFSISHTKERVFCALSERPVGIDAESVDRQIRLQLAEKILSPTERSLYDRAVDKRLTLLRFWVLKEAYVKCTGEGLRGYPNKTAFDPADPRIWEKDGCLVAVIEA